MLSAQYFSEIDFGKITTRVVDATKEVKFSTIGGKIKFYLGEFYDPNAGFVQIGGEFPRIKPRQTRDELNFKEKETLTSSLTTWIDLFFDRSIAPEYWTQLIDVIVLFSAYTNPFHDLESIEMELTAKLFFWFWHVDDILELALEQKIPVHTIEHATDHFMKILRGDKPEFTGIQGCPRFSCLADSLLDIHDRWLQFDPELHAHSDRFLFITQRYFDANMWFSVGEINQNYSEETFVHWRRLVAYFDGVTEIIFLLRKESLPKRISRSPLLRRILDIGNSSGAFVNDTIGLRKELENGERDNFVVFKIFEKNIDVAKAVEQVCGFLSAELHDFVLLRDTLLKEFGYHPNLVTYIDVIESVMDGHNLIYNKSMRHVSSGKVTLT